MKILKELQDDASQFQEFLQEVSIMRKVSRAGQGRERRQLLCYGMGCAGAAHAECVRRWFDVCIEREWGVQTAVGPGFCARGCLR